MTPEDFRNAVQSVISTWRTNYSGPGVAAGALPVFYENGPQPDEASVGPVWVDLEWRFYSGKLSELGTGMNRHTGVIAASVYTKIGEGTQMSEAVCKSLAALLVRKRWGHGATTYGYERMTPPPNFYGWQRSGLMVSFVLDEKIS